MTPTDKTLKAIEEAGKEGLEPFAVLFSNPETHGIANAVTNGFSAQEILRSVIYLYSQLERLVDESKQVDFEKTFVLTFLTMMESRHENEETERML